MQLQKRLVLFHYILDQIGYEDFETVRNEFNAKQTGGVSSGLSFFASAVLARDARKLPDQDVARYDEAILGYEKKLRDNRAEPYLHFKYYQWFALFFSEYYFDRYAQDAVGLLADLNDYLTTHKEHYDPIELYQKSDLKKLAYWISTGGGKTLLMHCNHWQITKYFPHWENIILLTPNEGLSQQHYEEFEKSGIPAKRYSGSEESLKTESGEVLIIEITKLVQGKEGEGVSVDVDYFSEAKNLLYIDEGHKGQRSEEQTWKKLRQYITRSDDSFTFEYSATFGQIVTNASKDLLQEYGKSIIFDYSYKHFYFDGYGKDFTVFNLDNKNAEYNEAQRKELFAASLLSFYEQLVLFEKYQEELRPYKVEKPLWVFVGSRVIGGSGSLTQADNQNISDVSLIIHFLAEMLESPKELDSLITKILGDASQYRNEDGEEIFKDSFEYLKKNKPKADAVLRKVFHGVGSLEAFTIKNADGEIGLKVKNSKDGKYFAVINIGDVAKYGKKLEEETEGRLVLQDDVFTDSMFQSISEPDSPITLLVGAKKFIEGWNSWRVSSMGLLNIGQSEGTQIIQLFGRGVRLKGKNFSLKREEPDAEYFIRALQKISIMGLNATYMNSFLDKIGKEVPEYTEVTIPITLNNEQKWKNRLLTLTAGNKDGLHDTLLELVYDTAVAKRVTLDMRSRVTLGRGNAVDGSIGATAVTSTDTVKDNIFATYHSFLDFQELYLEANRFKQLRGYKNLLISQATIATLFKKGGFSVYTHKGQFGLPEALDGSLARAASTILKDYITKFYADYEKKFISETATIGVLDKKQQDALFPEQREIIVRVPKDNRKFVEALESQIAELGTGDNKVLPTLHVGQHLYSPIVTYPKSDEQKQIKSVPTRLNEGEEVFLRHLREYIAEDAALGDKATLKGSEVYVLRNLSVRGVGFFMDSSMFYPDFIVWITRKDSQHIHFVDPKGILMGQTHFNNPKVLWCTEDVKQIETKVKADLKKQKKSVDVRVSGHILSVSPFDKVKTTWTAEKDVTEDDFKKHHILFIEESKEYIKKLLNY